MKAINWFKHAITGIVLITLAIGLVQLIGLDVEEENFGANILSSIFFLFLFIVLAVYRIDWIGRTRLNWLSTLLTLVSISALVIMLLQPKNVMALWKPSLAVFILLVGYTFYMKLDRKNWSAVVAKILLGITSGVFLYPLLVVTRDESYYTVSWYLLLATFLFAAIHAFLPNKQA